MTPKDKDNNNNFVENENKNKIVKNELIITYRKLDQKKDKKIERKKAFADMRSIVRDSFDEGKVNDEEKKEINKMEKPEAWFDNNTGENVEDVRIKRRKCHLCKVNVLEITLD